MPQLSPSKALKDASDSRSGITMTPTGPAKILTDLPASITTRRPLSPKRRQALGPGPSTPQQIGHLTNARSSDSQKQLSSDRKFFLASDGPPAKEKPTTKCDAFFSADIAKNRPRLSSTLSDTTILNSRPRSSSSEMTSSNERVDTRPKLRQIQSHQSKSVVREYSPTPRALAQGALRSRPPSQGEDQRRTRALSSAHSVMTDTSTSIDANTQEGGVASLIEGSKQPSHDIIADEIFTRTPVVVDIDSQPEKHSQSDRKILDLEIRNTSLLAVNTQIERKAREQSKELRALRERLAQLTTTPENSMKLEDDTKAEDDFQTVAESLLDTATDIDVALKRSLVLSEHLLEDARKGLAYRPRESEIMLRKVLLKADGASSHSSDSDISTGNAEEGEL